MKTTTLLGTLAAALVAVPACTKEKPPEQQGREEAAKRLDYVKGAGEVAKEKGEDTGRATGQGVGKLLRGLGTGVVDAVFPPVKLAASADLDGAGIRVNKSVESAGSKVELTLAFSKVFKGRLHLRAFDKAGVEMGRATTRTLNQPPDSLSTILAAFPASMRMSEIDRCDVTVLPPTPLALAGAAASGLSLGQMQESEDAPLTVTQYVIFDRAFRGSLQLRAYDATDAEIGRSAKLENQQFGADSSSTFEFVFDRNLERVSVGRYALHVEPARGK